MPVDFSSLRTDATYTRPQLAKLWGYRSYEALSRGVVTPAGTHFIILFITHEKQALLPQYQDELRDSTLEIEGERNHSSDNRIVNAPAAGDEIHLFYRDRHHMPFTYKGEIFLVEYEIRPEHPSRFEFTLDQRLIAARGAVATETRTHGPTADDFVANEEGRRSVQHRYVTSAA